MRKIWNVVFLIIILSISLIGCSNEISSKENNKADGNADYQVFEADVIEADDRLLVSPDKDSAEFSTSDKIVVGLSKAENIPDLIKPGDRIRIFYDGVIAESYPAQISAYMIELIGK